MMTDRSKRQQKEKKRKKERKKNPREENAYTHFDASKSVGIARSLARSLARVIAIARLPVRRPRIDLSRLRG